MKLLRFDPELCTLCGACIDKCPFRSHYHGEKGNYVK